MRTGERLICLTLIASYCSTAQVPSTANTAAPSTILPDDPAPARQGLTAPTESERLHGYLKTWVSADSMLNSAAAAGFGQARGTPKEWMESEGYARRFGSAYAQHAVSSAIMFGASSLLQEDNRYARSGESGSGNRLRYALESTLLARKYDAGGHSHRRLSISQIAAFAGAALISRTWQPRSTGSLRSGEFSFATTVGIAVGFNVMREFLPSWLPK
jgi:hypothetical protein